MKPTLQAGLGDTATMGTRVEPDHHAATLMGMNVEVLELKGRAAPKAAKAGLA